MEDFGENLPTNGYVKSLIELVNVNEPISSDTAVNLKTLVKHIGSYEGIPRARVVETEIVNPVDRVSISHFWEALSCSCVNCFYFSEAIVHRGSDSTGELTRFQLI